MSKTYRVRFEVYGENVHGSLAVSGFASAGTARALGGKFADVIAAHYSGAKVAWDIFNGESFLEDNGA